MAVINQLELIRKKQQQTGETHTKHKMSSKTRLRNDKRSLQKT